MKSGDNAVLVADTREPTTEELYPPIKAAADIDIYSLLTLRIQTITIDGVVGSTDLDSLKAALAKSWNSVTGNYHASLLFIPLFVPFII